MNVGKRKIADCPNEEWERDVVNSLGKQDFFASKADFREARGDPHATLEGIGGTELEGYEDELPPYEVKHHKSSESILATMRHVSAPNPKPPSYAEMVAKYPLLGKIDTDFAEGLVEAARSRAENPQDVFVKYVVKGAIQNSPDDVWLWVLDFLERDGIVRVETCDVEGSGGMESQMQERADRIL